MRTTADRPPKRLYRGNIGIDIFTEGNHHTKDACILLLPGVPTITTTAIQAKIPEGIYLKLVTQSSQTAQGITVLGGVIDTNYTSSIHVYLINLTNQIQQWPKQHAIAQLIVKRYTPATISIIQPARCSRTYSNPKQDQQLPEPKQGS
eukprot:TCALIF_13828-PA protein Name:"Similar to pol Pol polyprotein (Feline immunodeficiency virus (strain San Diego))" AED:0.20 eAED:0.20 QI:0/-1/0/1/-1/1/1/0/147